MMLELLALMRYAVTHVASLLYAAQMLFLLPVIALRAFDCLL